MALSSNNKRTKLECKWDLLFDKDQKDWFSTKPQKDAVVYPCYSCKHIFSGKPMYLDHINRRTTVLKYKCVKCPDKSTLTFYNSCALLLHLREHQIALENLKLDLNLLEVSSLPVHLAGLMQPDDPADIPIIHGEEEDYSIKEKINTTQFYICNASERGKTIVNLRPNNFFYCYMENNVKITVTLKQICSNVPVCKFIQVEVETKNQDSAEPPAIKEEPLDEPIETKLPVISKVETVRKNYKTCVECKKKVPSLKDHFQGDNRPISTLRCSVCKYIASSNCSFKAHTDMHLPDKGPFVCPDCGDQFKNAAFLRKHVDTICFHHAKFVRYRCPGRKCGKLFVMPATYGAHFAAHIQCLSQCNVCNTVFFKDTEFEEHKKLHDADCQFIKIYNCTVCKNPSALDSNMFQKHIDWHTADRDRCIYVYMCKCCRSYFRSTMTYAQHLLKCTKFAEANGKKTMGFWHYITDKCKECKDQIVYRKDSPVSLCTKCNILNMGRNGPPVVLPTSPSVEKKKNVVKKYICILCNKTLLCEEKAVHMKTCKYAKSRVLLNQVDIHLLRNEIQTKISNCPDNRNQNGVNVKPSVKRKRLISPVRKLQEAEEPMDFDGKYICKVCKFKCEIRQDFHDHIITHRDISTAYQCMECAECFVVKPSLIKHLIHCHNISEYENYFAENNCYDKAAVKELQETLKLLPGESKLPVAENQCNICREQFDDSVTFNKHFRTHGMAFLKKNVK